MQTFNVIADLLRNGVLVTNRIEFTVQVTQTLRQVTPEMPSEWQSNRNAACDQMTKSAQLETREIELITTAI